MSCIISPSAPRADIRLAAEDVNKFPLPLVSKLCAQNDGSHGCGSYRFWWGSFRGWVVESEIKIGRGVKYTQKAASWGSEGGEEGSDEKKDGGAWSWHDILTSLRAVWQPQPWP